MSSYKPMLNRPAGLGHPLSSMSGGSWPTGRLRSLSTLLSGDARPSSSVASKPVETKTSFGQLWGGSGPRAPASDVEEQTLEYPETGLDNIGAQFPSKSEPLRAWDLAAEADPPMTQAYPDSMSNFFQQPLSSTHKALEADPPMTQAYPDSMSNIFQQPLGSAHKAAAEDPPMTQSYPDAMSSFLQQPFSFAQKSSLCETARVQAASSEPREASRDEDGGESDASTQEYPEEMPEDPALQVPIRRREAKATTEAITAPEVEKQPAGRSLAQSALDSAPHQVDFPSTQAYPEIDHFSEAGAVREAASCGKDTVYDFPATQMYDESPPRKGEVSSLTSPFKDKTINWSTGSAGSIGEAPRKGGVSSLKSPFGDKTINWGASSAASASDCRPSPVKSLNASLCEDDSVFPATQCYEPDMFGGLIASSISEPAGQGKTIETSISPSGSFQAGCQSIGAASGCPGAELGKQTKAPAASAMEEDPWFMATQCYETLPPEPENDHSVAAASSASKPAASGGLLALAQQAVRAACDEECAMLATQWYTEDPPDLGMAKTESLAMPPEAPQDKNGISHAGRALLSEVQSDRAEPPGVEPSSLASKPGPEPPRLDRPCCAEPCADAGPRVGVEPRVDAAQECSTASVGKEPERKEADSVTAADVVPSGQEPENKPAKAVAGADTAPSSGAAENAISNAPTPVEAGEAGGLVTKVLGENGGGCYMEKDGLRKTPHPLQTPAMPPPDALAGSSGSEARAADMPPPAAAEGGSADPTLSADQLLQGMLTLLRRDETELLHLLRSLDVEVPGLLARAMGKASSMTKSAPETLKKPSAGTEAVSTKRSKPSGANQGGVLAQKRQRRATSPGGVGSGFAAEGHQAPASSTGSAASGSMPPKSKGKTSSDDDDLLTIGSDDDEMPLIPSKLASAESGLQARRPMASHANGWTYGSRGGPSSHLGGDGSDAAIKGPGQLRKGGQGGSAASSTVLHSVRPSQSRGGPSNAVANSTELPPRLQVGQSSAAHASKRKQDTDGSAAQERQLRQIADMGFSDRSQALRALGASNGDLSRAVDMLLSGEC